MKNLLSSSAAEALASAPSDLIRRALSFRFINSQSLEISARKDDLVVILIAGHDSAAGESERNFSLHYHNEAFQGRATNARENLSRCAASNFFLSSSSALLSRKEVRDR